MKKILIENQEVLIGRNNNKLFACDNACPHKGASLHKGEIKDASLVCYMHGYEFDIESGKLTNKKSWKRRDTWMEQSDGWRESGDLIMYDIQQKENKVFLNFA